MIPSIETIVEDLLAGKITKSQAVTWLYVHSEGAANELQDGFAMAALRGLIPLIGIPEKGPDDLWDAATAKRAYSIADAMLEARKVKQ